MTVHPMMGWLRDRFEHAYTTYLLRQIETPPAHVAIIQDGNRRFAGAEGSTHEWGHAAGAATTESVLRWCADIGVKELTLYAFSTENFSRPPAEQEAVFSLIARKLREFADAAEVHDREVTIRAIGDRDRLPPSVRSAIRYAEDRTAQYDRLRLNIAVGYGGRSELLGAAREAVTAVAAGEITPAAITVEYIDQLLSARPTRAVDLIIRTGGDARTSNFLPWHANGNEAAVYFCAPYWPEFSRIDFLRGIRTYISRERSFQRSETERAIALIRTVAASELALARQIARGLRSQLSPRGARRLARELAAIDTADADQEPKRR
jgi:tritrans,polycis-undecaprenyl-diphosphate synthase [geranylgeranyl-diphosphate specific]